MDDIMMTLKDVFEDIFDEQDITLNPETTANDVDGWDSLSNSLLILAIEVRFKITFTQKEMLNFRNVGDMANCNRSKLQFHQG